MKELRFGDRVIVKYNIERFDSTINKTYSKYSARNKPSIARNDGFREITDISSTHESNQSLYKLTNHNTESSLACRQPIVSKLIQDAGELRGIMLSDINEWVLNQHKLHRNSSLISDDIMSESENSIRSFPSLQTTDSPHESNITDFIFIGCDEPVNIGPTDLEIEFSQTIALPGGPAHLISISKSLFLQNNKDIQNKLQLGGVLDISYDCHFNVFYSPKHCLARCQLPDCGKVKHREELILSCVYYDYDDDEDLAEDLAQARKRQIALQQQKQQHLSTKYLHTDGHATGWPTTSTADIDIPSSSSSVAVLNSTRRHNETDGVIDKADGAVVEPDGMSAGHLICVSHLLPWVEGDGGGRGTPHPDYRDKDIASFYYLLLQNLYESHPDIYDNINNDRNNNDHQNYLISLALLFYKKWTRADSAVEQLNVIQQTLSKQEISCICCRAQNVETTTRIEFLHEQIFPTDNSFSSALKSLANTLQLNFPKITFKDIFNLKFNDNRKRISDESGIDGDENPSFQIPSNDHRRSAGSIASNPNPNATGGSFHRSFASPRLPQKLLSPSRRFRDFSRNSLALPRVPDSSNGEEYNDGVEEISWDRDGADNKSHVLDGIDRFYGSELDGEREAEVGVRYYDNPIHTLPIPFPLDGDALDSFQYTQNPALEHPAGPEEPLPVRERDITEECGVGRGEAIEARLVEEREEGVFGLSIYSFLSSIQSMISAPKPVESLQLDPSRSQTSQLYPEPLAVSTREAIPRGEWGIEECCERFFDYDDVFQDNNNSNTASPEQGENPLFYQQHSYENNDSSLRNHGMGKTLGSLADRSVERFIASSSTSTRKTIFNRSSDEPPSPRRHQDSSLSASGSPRVSRLLTAGLSGKEEGRERGMGGIEEFYDCPEPSPKHYNESLGNDHAAWNAAILDDRDSYGHDRDFTSAERLPVMENPMNHRDSQTNRQSKMTSQSYVKANDLAIVALRRSGPQRVHSNKHNSIISELFSSEDSQAIPGLLQRNTPNEAPSSNSIGSPNNDEEEILDLLEIYKQIF